MYTNNAVNAWNAHLLCRRLVRLRTVSIKTCTDSNQESYISVTEWKIQITVYTLLETVCTANVL